MIRLIYAGVVTYEPDLERLHENLSGIHGQVARVIVFDNGSNDVENISAMVREFSNASLVRSAENVGIAAALNRIAELALSEGATWLVTLDQDSVCSDGMVAELRNAHSPGVAIVAPHIIDRNKQVLSEARLDELPSIEHYRRAARKGAITSGSLVLLQAWSEVEGFDENFFIDYVDYDFNQRIMNAGFLIIRSNRTYLLHEVGRARPTPLWVPRKDLSGKWRLERFYSFGHSPFRCYFKARNRVLFTRKYGKQLGLTHEGIWQLPQQILLTLIFEKQRLPKLKAFFRGVRDGIRENVGHVKFTSEFDSNGTAPEKPHGL